MIKKGVIYVLLILLSIQLSLSLSFVSPTPESDISGNSIYINLSSQQQSTFVDFDNDLIFGMTMQKNSSDSFVDISSYSNSVSPINSPISNSTFGLYGNGTGFNGRTNYLYINDSASLNSLSSSNKMTVCTWMKPYSNTNGIQTGNNMGVIGQWWASGRYNYNNRSFGIMRTGAMAGNLYGFYLSSNGLAYDYSISDSNIPLNQWTHICGTFNGSTVKMYINAIQQSRNGSVTSLYNAAAPLTVGTYYYSANLSADTDMFFNGSIDEVYLWKRDLSIQEIKALYNSTLNKYEKNFTNLQSSTHTFTAYTLSGSELSSISRSIATGSLGYSVSFSSPTDSSSIIERRYILVNVSSNYPNLQNISIFLYNSSGLINSSISLSSPIYANFSNLQNGIYYFNATACNSSSCYSTETRNVNISVTGNLPSITLSSPTYQENDFLIQINTSTSASLCWFTLNNGTTNTTMFESSTTNFYYEDINYGAYNITYYCQNENGVSNLSSTLTLKKVISFEDVYYTNSQGLKIYFDMNFNYTSDKGKVIVIPDSWTALKDTTWVWDTEKLYMTQGYVAVAVNTRGKGSSQGTKDAFGWECLDIYELVNELQKNNLYNQHINNSAVYISGASGAGGKAGVCSAKYPDLFSAAFSSVGVLNLSKWWYTASASDVSEMEIRVGCSASSCPEAYTSRDASYLNFNTQSNVMLISNRDDDRVNVNCSRDYNYSSNFNNKTHLFYEFTTGAHTVYRFNESFPWFSFYDSTIYMPQNGTLRLGGYVHTKNFSFYFDNVSKIGELSYSISTNKSFNLSTLSYNGPVNISVNDLSINSEYLINFTSNHIIKNSTSTGNLNFSLNITNSTLLSIFISPKSAFCGDSVCNNQESCSSCSIDCGSCPSTPSGGSGGGGGGGGGGSSGSVTISNISSSSASFSISDIIVNPLERKKISVSIQNTGKSFLNGCKLKASGEFSSWFSSSDNKGLSSGELSDFIFDLDIPQVSPGKYPIMVTLECNELSLAKSFNAEIIDKKILVVINKAEKKGDKLNVKYSLDNQGSETEAEIIITVLDGNNKVAEQSYTKNLADKNFEDTINLESNLVGSYNLLISVKTKTYSSFSQENILLGKSRISGFAIFNSSKSENFIIYFFIILFLIFAIFMVKRIIKLKKISKENSKNFHPHLQSVLHTLHRRIK